MKIFAILSLFSSLAPAAPSQLAKRLPDHTPVTVNEFDSSFDVNCGKVTVKGSDIEKAVSWAVNLQVAKETVGRAKYPHRYNNHEGFNFHNNECNEAQNRYGFPVAQNDYYNGGNDPPYKFRAIYVYKREEDVQTHPMATYCGTIFHPSGNSFQGCDVSK